MSTKILHTMLLNLFLSSACFAGVTLSLSGSSYNYSMNTKTQLTGGDIKLYDNAFGVNLAFEYGDVSLKKTLGEYKERNFQHFNYKSAPLFFSVNNPLWLIVLPSLDIKQYDEPGRTFDEKTLSIWLGLFSYSQKEDNNIKSQRYGLTTSLFAEEMRSLYNYLYSNPPLGSKKTKDGCDTHFWYIGGTTLCQHDDLFFYGYYGLAYDYYAINVEHPLFGNGSGSGYKYGISAVAELRYGITENNFLALGVDTSYYTGTETITFDTQTKEDDITRENTNISFKLISHF